MMTTVGAVAMMFLLVKQFAKGALDGWDQLLWGGAFMCSCFAADVGLAVSSAAFERVGKAGEVLIENGVRSIIKRVRS